MIRMMIMIIEVTILNTNNLVMWHQVFLLSNTTNLQTDLFDPEI